MKAHLGVEECILRAVTEIQALMDRAFEEVSGTPAAGSALDQLGLRNGDAIVRDYLAHGEPGLAYEHLRHMVQEPPLAISSETRELLEAAARHLGQPPF